MPLTMVVGGQFGGEGKGLISAALTRFDKVETAVRPGGPNSAHTVHVGGQRIQLRMVPTGALAGASTIVLPAGSLIHVDTLLAELKQTGFKGRILVDPNAGLVEKHHIETQQKDSFYKHAGSTLTGTGAAMADRARRRLRLAKSEPRFSGILEDTRQFLHDALRQGANIIVEGCQGFGLSNYHGEYPFVTNRDCTASAFLSQCGLSPGSVNTVVLVLKCLPTRNQIGEGTLTNELDPELLISNGADIIEFGGGTYGEKGLPRRVGLFDFDLAMKAAQANNPQYLALTGLDVLEKLMRTEKVKNYYRSITDFKIRLEKQLGVPIGLESRGPSIEDVVDIREKIYR